MSKRATSLLTAWISTARHHFYRALNTERRFLMLRIFFHTHLLFNARVQNTFHFIADNGMGSVYSRVCGPPRKVNSFPHKSLSSHQSLSLLSSFLSTVRDNERAFLNEGVNNTFSFQALERTNVGFCESKTAEITLYQE